MDTKTFFESMTESIKTLGTNSFDKRAAAKELISTMIEGDASNIDELIFRRKFYCFRDIIGRLNNFIENSAENVALESDKNEFCVETFIDIHSEIQRIITFYSEFSIGYFEAGVLLRDGMDDETIMSFFTFMRTFLAIANDNFAVALAWYHVRENLYINKGSIMNDKSTIEKYGMLDYTTAEDLTRIFAAKHFDNMLITNSIFDGYKNGTLKTLMDTYKSSIVWWKICYLSHDFIE